MEMFSFGIRIILVAGSLCTALFILWRVRQSKVQIEDTIFWLVFAGALMLLSLFPEIASWCSQRLGFMAPINFVYLVIIFLLLIKQFYMSLRISQLDSKLRILTQRVALNQQQIDKDQMDL